MNDDLAALTQQPWHWEWVPAVRPGEPAYEEWTEYLVGLFEEWTSEGLAAVRATWPADAGAEFPITPDMPGRDAARWLLERAGQLPAGARLAWGAAFVGDRPRWAPVPVVVEFRGPAVGDPNYLMDLVGARGMEGDAREPVVDYVTTSIGDGLRVFALCRSAEGAAYARVHAAMRLDVPPTGGAPGVGIDVMLTTLVFEMGLMALIGNGVEQLMHRTADECAPSDGGPALLGFVAAAEVAAAEVASTEVAATGGGPA
ncbi:hypothetical protein P3T36_004289 [Kitasatospora sp. MAP12-15]|uniref:hypothetical protein n=1 Tax=unclassified Kitasatospora TaxID=2633591 RepID=UPI002475FB83|nr:hypothetical protein [Kitasatospora sp. MAP12-44]MDH6108246.1 hypothetical protein [Kitasatospora sp. MAP12-44]